MRPDRRERPIRSRDDPDVVEGDDAEVIGRPRFELAYHFMHLVRDMTDHFSFTNFTGVCVWQRQAILELEAGALTPGVDFPGKNCPGARGD